MSGLRLEVQWSPVHPDKFITWGTEIFLYEVLQLKDNSRNSFTKISDISVSNLLATISNIHYIKCIDIYPQPEEDILLAIGQANGKVVLNTFGPSVFDSLGYSGKELSPKHARACNAVAWNPLDSNFLAMGLEKYRSEHSVLIWDVSRPNCTTPFVEFGLSETTNSLAWFHQQPKCIVIGMNGKQLKIVDLRDSSKTASTTPTKLVHGVCVDPFSDYQLCSQHENHMGIWDTRNFEKPLLTLSKQKPIIKSLWCPTRHNLIGSILKDSNSIVLHDIQHSVAANDELEPNVLERMIQPGSSIGFIDSSKASISSLPHIASFSWHPSHENRLLTISLPGTLVDLIVSERMSLGWAAASHLAWTFGRRTVKLISDKDAFYNQLNDISTKMKRRAIDEYGLKAELWQNGDLAEDEALKNVWHWLFLSRSLVEDGSIRGVDSKLPGIRCVLRLESGLKSALEQMRWSDLPNNNSFVPTVKIYRSDERDKALQLCGWRFDKETLALDTFLDRLESEGAYTRAAAVAVFNLKLRMAVRILGRGGSHLRVVGFAMSGFPSGPIEAGGLNSMWHELCQSCRTQLNDPYLNAAFAFLTADGENYDAVLNEEGIAVEDRVAFACIFLSDSKLGEFISTLTERLTAEGDLAGILLTGTSQEGITLLQRFLDQTGDVQSASLLAVRAFPPEVIKLEESNQVSDWLNSYRNLLDAWRLWNQRAQTDIMVNICTLASSTSLLLLSGQVHSSSTTIKPPQLVFVTCNFCGKSISAQMQGASRQRATGTLGRLGATGQKLKMHACPQCRKPLPRCAICLVHMGTPSGIQQQHIQTPTTNGRSNKLSEFSTWFTWCQTCRHGGHANHITHWFKEHLECPVTGCTCRCMSLDASSVAKLPR